MKKLLIFLMVVAIVLSVWWWSGMIRFNNALKPLAVVNTQIGQVNKCISINGLPDPKCNQPIINPNLTLAQVCSPTFKTGTIRPPTSYTNKLKNQGMIDYNYPLNAALVEEDHLGAITDDFSPTDTKNLWPQFWNLNVGGFDAGAHTKDKLEVKVHKLLCSGKMTLAEDVECFTDWIKCYRKYIGELPKYKIGAQNLGASVE